MLEDCASINGSSASFHPLCLEGVNSLFVVSIVVYTVNHMERNSLVSQNEASIVVYAANHAIVVYTVNQNGRNSLATDCESKKEVS